MRSLANLLILACSLFPLATAANAQSASQSIRKRMDDAIEVLEAKQHDKFLREFVDPELVRYYMGSGDLHDVVKFRNGWLRLLKLTRGEELHFSNEEKSATLNYAYDDWAVSANFTRSGEVWYLTTPGNQVIFLDRGRDFEQMLHSRDERGRTLLHRAVEKNDLKEAKKWVRHHIDLLAKDNQGKSALDLAESAGNTDIADFLRRRIAKKALE